MRWRASLALIAILVAGCSTARGEHRALRNTDGKIILDYWNGFTGPDGQTMQRLVQQFREANPDLQVRMQIIPWGTYYDKLTLSLAYGGAPDLFIMQAHRLPEYASFGVLQPLEERYAGDSTPLGEGDFAAAPWKASFYGGKQVGLPLDVWPLGLYYNTRLFREAGIVDGFGAARPPVTWSDFVADARKLTRDLDADGKPDQWGFAFTNQHSNWYTFAAQSGGGFLSPDNGTCAMDSEASLAATEQMRELIYQDHVAPKPEGVDPWLGFRQGKIGMAMEGIYMLSSLEEEKGLEFAGAPVPRFGARRATWAGSHMLCQPAGIDPERSRAAWRLMRFLSDHSLAWAKGGQVPARTSVLRSPEFAAMRVQAEFAKQLRYIRYEPLHPRLNAMYQFVDPAIEACLLDLQPPPAAMRDACRRIEQVLKRP